MLRNGVREEDIKYDLFRAATCQRIEAGLDGQGQLISRSHKAVAGSILKLINPKGLNFLCLTYEGGA